MPPVAVIEQWIVDKGIWAKVKSEFDRGQKWKSAASKNIKVKFKGGKRKGQVKVYKVKKLTGKAGDKALHALAFVMARSIGKKGIEGRHFSASAIVKAIPKINDIWARLGDDVVATITGYQSGGGVPIP